MLFDSARSRTYDTRPMSRPPAESPTASRHSVDQFVVDANVLAHAGLTWERKFSDISFARLVDATLSTRPAVAIKLNFSRLDQRPVISGDMRAEIELMCQRCMRPMVYPAHERFELMLVESEAELPSVPESHEPWIANAVHLNLLELIEEQLLLALPLIAKHADERDCINVSTSAETTAPGDEVQRPFGNLRDLLRKD